MDTKNIVFIAKSLDGYIADKNGGLEWLNSIPNPEHIDMGYVQHINSIDAIIMGRTTFEVVCSFDIDWPYSKPVFVLSTTMEKVPVKYKDKVTLVKGSLKGIIRNLNENGYKKLYIDGGATINSFLKEDMIDDMIISTIPVLLGGGVHLFRELPEVMEFEHIASEVFLGAIVQDHYRRKRK